MTGDEEEYTEEVRKKHSELAKEKEALQSLLQHPGWKFIAETIQEELTRLRDDYETSGPITTGNIYINEYRRAQLNIMRWVLDLPHLSLQSATEATQALRQLMHPNDGDDNG